MQTKRTAMLSMLAVVLLLTGCGGQGKTASDTTGQASPEKQKQEPVTLKFYAKTPIDDFEKYINQFVKKKFPHVTLQVVENKKGSEIQDLITANEIPDIIWEGLTNMGAALAEYDVPMDLTPLAKKYGFDMNKYDTKLVDSIKSYSSKGEILYIPYNVLVFGLHYNKDIFDKFGVSYPKDNRTWEEVTELGKRLTRKEGDLQYIGLRPPLGVNRVQSQLSLSYVDAGGQKAVLAADGWKRLFDTFKSMNEFPNAPVIKSFFDARDEFLKKRTVAMLPDILQLQNSDMALLEKEGLKWDFVTYPTFKDKPGVGVGVFSDGFVLPKGSKHADLAFQIVTFLSTDPDVQTEATKNGRITALKDPKVLEHAFENNPAAKGKNVQSVLTQKYPDPIRSSPYNGTGSGIINAKLVDYVNGKADVNTLLKQAEEEFDKKIAELKSK
ncbi:extracellular solute-binding protein [Paenibacillus hemerocallicola]|uniref:Extracellular solute-binding protein n=1 Tax=Paenibacillus hemerocallicola TaxID=1172614 RepID=A0A5C4T931_9BACL|nr:extracellular solute-binding protein [Paenibacillus hemerocallicola]TNJ65385.1 extracellular solute-binding protein [Paenibacillus hemerocallicola]